MSAPRPAGRVDLARWRAALADPSGRGFDAIAATGVRLESSVLALPLSGIDVVWPVLVLLESLFDEVRYGEELVGATVVQLAWAGRALGVAVQGATTLGLDGDGRVARIVLHHRPLGAVLLLSATLADRLPPPPNGNGNGRPRR